MAPQIDNKPGCCSWLGTRFVNGYNSAVDGLARMTFKPVEKLRIGETTGTLARVAKVFAAFLMTATIVPLVALFAGAGISKLWAAMCGSKKPVEAPRPEVPAVAAPEVVAGGQRNAPVAEDVQAEGQAPDGQQPPANADAVNA